MNFKLTKKNTQVAAIFLLATDHLFGVDAHGYLKSPRSRNYQASINPIWSGGTSTDPAPENCPHCLNIGGTEARCGKVGEWNNYC
jgi:predicted carbohydrate-binding protein with CBM5 and CBM33 domain